LTDSDALLAAIAANPDDDAPRLIYADWLDEHGDPARAEFIRVQIALTRISVDDPNRHVLKLREKALRKRNRNDWLRPLSDLGWDGERFSRGFVTTARLVQEIDIPTPTSEFAGVNCLFLSYTKLTDAGLRDLASCPQLAGVRVLHLSRTCITDSGIQAITGSRSFQKLSCLHVQGVKLKQIGLQALATSSSLAELKTIWIDDRDLFIAALRKARTDAKETGSSTPLPALESVWRGALPDDLLPFAKRVELSGSADRVPRHR
jgi:uncharacterized protein (TIGR02996 family)